MKVKKIQLSCCSVRSYSMVVACMVSSRKRSSC